MSAPRKPTARVTHLTLGTVNAMLIDLPVDDLELPDSLTSAEQDVVRLVAQGLSNSDIGKARGRSARTIANQLAAIYRKVGVTGRTELLAHLTGGT